MTSVASLSARQEIRSTPGSRNLELGFLETAPRPPSLLRCVDRSVRVHRLREGGWSNRTHEGERQTAFGRFHRTQRRSPMDGNSWEAILGRGLVIRWVFPDGSRSVDSAIERLNTLPISKPFADRNSEICKSGNVCEKGLVHGVTRTMPCGC